MELYPQLRKYETGYVTGVFEKADGRIEAIRWLINDKLKINPEKALKEVNIQLCQKYGIRRAVDLHDGGIYKLITEAFPDVKMEIARNKVGSVIATTEEREYNNFLRDLIENKIGIKDINELKNLSYEEMKYHGVGRAVIYRRYENIYYMLESIYGKLPFGYWQMKVKIPSKFWEEEQNRIDAMRWFVNEYNDYLGFPVNIRMRNANIHGMVYKYYHTAREIYKYK